MSLSKRSREGDSPPDTPQQNKKTKPADIDLNSMTILDIKVMLKDLGLKPRGSKAELIIRLNHVNFSIICVYKTLFNILF
jgi:hypothetical protein